MIMENHMAIMEKLMGKPMAIMEKHLLPHTHLHLTTKEQLMVKVPVEMKANHRENLLKRLDLTMSNLWGGQGCMRETCL